MNNVEEFDRIVTSLGRISLLAQLRDKVLEAAKTTERRCGACIHWMHSSSCPRETRVKGRRQGPSCNGTPCHKFAIEDWIVELRSKRIAEAVEFAERHGLPIPPSLSAANAQCSDEEPKQSVGDERDQQTAAEA